MQNQQERIAVIGDIHGCNRELKLLLEKIKNQFGNIPIYACGDLVDRGPDSKGVIETLIQNQIVSVLGNHDLPIKELITDTTIDDFVLSEITGGIATLKSYMPKESLKLLDKDSPSLIYDIFINFLNHVPDSHKEYFVNLPLFTKVLAGNTTVIISHGGIDKSYFTHPRHIPEKKYIDRVTIDSTYENLEFLYQDKDTREKICDSLLWGRPHFQKPKVNTVADFGPNTIQVFGHTPIPHPIMQDHFVAIDTGSCFPDLGLLTAVILPDRKFIQVQNEF